MPRDGLPSPHEVAAFFKESLSPVELDKLVSNLPAPLPLEYPNWDAMWRQAYHYFAAIMYAAGLATPDTPWKDVHRAVENIERIQKEMLGAVSSYDVPDGDRRLGWWSVVGAAVLKKLQDPEITEEERALYRAYEIYLATFYTDSSIFCLDLVTIEGVEVAVAAPAPELALAYEVREAGENDEDGTGWPSAGEADEDCARQAKKAKARCRKARCRKARR